MQVEWNWYFLGSGLGNAPAIPCLWPLLMVLTCLLEAVFFLKGFLGCPLAMMKVMLFKINLPTEAKIRREGSVALGVERL